VIALQLLDGIFFVEVFLCSELWLADLVAAGVVIFFSSGVFM
jgi:hypothetical protein